MDNSKGAAMIEFALVLPLLAILVFGIIEFGLIIYNKAMITNASREGARVGIVFRVDSNGDYIPPDDPAVNSLIETRINDYLSTYLISFDPAAAKTISTLVTGTSPGGELKVTVTYPYKFLAIPGFSSILGSTIVPTITLSAVTSMRLE